MAISGARLDFCRAFDKRNDGCALQYRIQRRVDVIAAVRDGNAGSLCSLSDSVHEVLSRSRHASVRSGNDSFASGLLGRITRDVALIRHEAEDQITPSFRPRGTTRGIVKVG